MVREFSLRVARLEAALSDYETRLARIEAAKPAIKPHDTGELRRSRAAGARTWKLLVEYFDEGELDLLAFGLDVTYSELPGEDKSGRAKALVGHMLRRNRLQDLILAAQAERGFVEWPVLPRGDGDDE